MNPRKYTQAFKEDVVRKMLMRGNRTIADMAEELNVPYHSARNLLRDPRMTHLRRPLPSEKHPCSASCIARRKHCQKLRHC